MTRLPTTATIPSPTPATPAPGSRQVPHLRVVGDPPDSTPARAAVADALGHLEPGVQAAVAGAAFGGLTHRQLDEMRRAAPGTSARDITEGLRALRAHLRATGRLA